MTSRRISSRETAHLQKSDAVTMVEVVDTEQLNSSLCNVNFILYSQTEADVHGWKRYRDTSEFRSATKRRKQDSIPKNYISKPISSML